jgi:hypothetical protein
MGTQKQALCILMTLFINGCTSSSVFTKEEEDFRKYAASICMGSSFKIPEIEQDANISANGYMGNISLDSYDELRSLVTTWKRSEFMGKSGHQANIMRCLEFSESQEIKQIFDRYNPCLDSSNWLDQQEFKAQCN